MPALDRFHNAVQNALVADGWTITDNPLTLKALGTNLHIDLGAEKMIAAEKGTRKIAVEIKTFGGPSFIADLQQAIGQFIIYEDVLAELEPERLLYLAVPDGAFEELALDSLGRAMLERRLPRVITFSPEAEVIIEWIP